MTYSATDLAKYIVTYCYCKQKPVSNLKLQKMLYYAWIEYYKETGRAVFLDDICAWQLGPVVPEVYYTFCAYAGLPITKNFMVKVDEEDEPIINKIIDRYLPISASTLVQKSHTPGNPWFQIYQGGVGNRRVIPFSLIKDLECNS